VKTRRSEMVSVNIRELTHNFSSYLKRVKNGTRIVVMERNTPIADIIPHNENVVPPGWKRPIQKIAIKGVCVSDMVVKSRRAERN